MNTLYVIDQGAVVRQSSRSIVITKDEKRITQVPVIKLDRLLLFGNVQVTTQAINLLLDEGIDVAFLSMNGKLRGRLLASESKNILIRIAQYERYLDDQYQVDMARQIVRGKITNTRAFILRISRSYPDMDFNSELELIDQTLTKLEHQITVNSLMGSEGIATATYFRAFGRMFRKDLTFKERTRRPPKDPVNAVLSLGYTMITNEILSLITAHGLDPYIGFLHGVVYGRPSLALDLVEEFRTPIVDRLTLNLFNNEILTQDDFRPVENKGIYLQPEALKTYFQYYDKRLKSKVKQSKASSGRSFRDIMKRQVLKMSKAIETGEMYKPFRMRS